MKPTEKEFAATVERVKAINDKLKAKGYDWEQIDQFWAGIFREQEKKRSNKQIATG